MESVCNIITVVSGLTDQFFLYCMWEMLAKDNFIKILMKVNKIIEFNYSFSS